MDPVGEVPFPRGWDVKFGKKDSASSTIISLAPDYSLAISELMSLQMWVIDSNSQLELVVLDSPILAICWISVDLICVGMLNGEVVIISKADDGFVSNEKKSVVQFRESPVKSLRLSSMSGSGIMTESDSLSKTPQEVGTLWVLYDDNVLLASSVSDILDYVSEDSVLPKHVSCTLTGVSLKDGNGNTSDIKDALACCHASPSLLDITANLNSDVGKKINILACGSSPYPLTFYSLGSSSGKPRGFRQIARHAAHALKVSAVSFLGSFIGSAAASEEEKVVISLQESNGLRDDRRNISSVVLDPSLKYALCSDNLGRVLLVDVETNMVIRLWKGVREAQCGWIQEAKDNRSSPLLYICIYSPKRGFVEIFSALHGPKIRTITVGVQARLLTTVGPSSSTAITLSQRATTCLSSCAILRVNNASQEAPKMEVFKLDHIPPPSTPSSSSASLSRSRSEVTVQAPLSLTAAVSVSDISEEAKEAVGEDMALVQNLAVVLESVQDGAVEFEQAESEALGLFRRLKTSAGVRDASLMITSLCTVKATFKQHLTLLRNVNEWAVDADQQDLLLHIQKDDTQSLSKFLKQRSVLMDAYESVRMIHDESLNDMFESGSTVTPEGWCKESWRVEAAAWANIQSRDMDEETPIISLCRFLSLLEVKASKVPTDLLTELSNFMFRPLLQDVFVLTTVAKAMRDIGPCMPLLLKDKSVCLNPAAASIDSSSSLFVGDTIHTWAPTAVHLLTKWLRSQYVGILNRNILEKSATSSGVLRFLESLCAHSIEALDTNSSTDVAPPLSPCWVHACEACSSSTTNHATCFVVAVILQEAHCRTTKILESKTYGMKASPVSPRWEQVLCGLRCCLLIGCRRLAVETSFAQLVSCGVLPRAPTALLTTPPLSANSFQNVERGEESIMNIIVQDRCALDLLHSHQVIWARNSELSLSKKPEEVLKKGKNEKSGEEGGWPDPKQPNSSYSTLWTSIAFDQIINSELSTKLKLKSHFKSESLITVVDRLTTLTLPPEWVPLAELFVYNSHSSTVTSNLSRFCFHCHCSMMVARIMTHASQMDELGLRIQSLELAVSHILAISRNQLPIVKKSSHVMKDSDIEHDGKTVVEITRLEKKWYDFFDYDMPTEGYTHNDDKARGQDEYAQVVAAALAIRIFEDVIFPEVMSPFLIAQRDSESDKSRLSNCFLTPNRTREDVTRFCFLTCTLLDQIKLIDLSTFETSLRRVSGVLLLVKEEADVHLPFHDSKDWGVSEGKEWLLGRAAALEREYQMNLEDDDGLDINDTEESDKNESDILNEILTCGGDRMLEKTIIVPSLKSLPSMLSVGAHVLSLRMVAAIEVVKQSHMVRPPVQLVLGPEFSDLTPHALAAAPMATPETNAHAVMKRFFLKLFVSLLSCGVDSPSYADNTSTIYRVGEALNQSPQMPWSEGVDWLDVANISHILALASLGGMDDKALELTTDDIGNRELLGDVVLYVCGVRIKLTIDHLLKDRTGKFAPLVASLDAGLCDANAARSQDRQSSNPLLTECVVKMNAVSHEGTLALLAHVIQSTQYHSLLSANKGDMVHALSLTQFSQEAQDMRTLLTSVLEGLRRLSKARK